MLLMHTMHTERRRLPFSILATLLAVSSIASAGVASAASAEPASTDDRIRAIQELIGDASEEEARAIVELEDVRSRRAALDEVVVALDGELRDATAGFEAARAEEDRLTARYVAISLRLDATRARLREAKERFNESVAALYRRAGGAAASYVALVIDSAGPQDLYAGSRYLRGVTAGQWAAVEMLGSLRDEIEILGKRRESDRLEAAEARSAAEDESRRLAGLRAEQEARRGDAVAEQAAEERLVAEIRNRVAGYEAELAALQTTSSAIGAMLASRQAGQALAGAFVAVRPVPGEITSGFGQRVHPILGTVRMHTGVDMHAEYGTSIVSGAAGVVVWAGWRDGYGNTVIIDHGNQYATLYAHQSVVHVSVGQRVEAGQTVGAVGSTGMSTGPHLHFEVRVLGVPVDPAAHL